MTKTNNVLEIVTAPDDVLTVFEIIIRGLDEHISIWHADGSVSCPLHVTGPGLPKREPVECASLAHGLTIALTAAAPWIVRALLQEEP